MNPTIQEKLEIAKKVSKENLVNLLKSKIPDAFDWIIVGEEYRYNYFYFLYKAIATSRAIKTINFPLDKETEKIYNLQIEQNGKIRKLEDSKFLKLIYSKFKTKLKEHIETTIIDKEIIDIPIELTQDGEIAVNQPIYYIPKKCKKVPCVICNGEKYVICPEPQCGGKHIFQCFTCSGLGNVQCEKCVGNGKVRCHICRGKGFIECPECYGSGSYYDKKFKSRKCKNCKGSGKLVCKKCNGEGELKCSECYGNGFKVCKECKGVGKITCKTCYGDNIDNRFGKIDCPECEALGKFAYISYISTKINQITDELILSSCNDKFPRINKEIIKKYIDSNNITYTLTYRNINGDFKENYNEFTEICSSFELKKNELSKDNFPKLLKEEIFYDIVPTSTLSYYNLLAEQPQLVTFVGLHNEITVVLHSDPHKYNITFEQPSKLKLYFSKAFSTKLYKNIIDKKHEIISIIHLAKADGIIDEIDKKYFAKTFKGFNELPSKEKSEIYSLLKSQDLPPLKPEEMYFYQMGKSEEVKSTLLKMFEEMGTNKTEAVNQKLKEILDAIDKGVEFKPTFFKNFISTWQVSIPIIIFLLFSLTITLALVFDL